MKDIVTVALDAQLRGWRESGCPRRAWLPGCRRRGARDGSAL